jgi:hypothetical protein
MKRLIYYWWYLFFVAFWTAHSLGEKKAPESNAIYFLSFILGLNLFGFFEVLKYFGFNLSITMLIIFCLVPAIMIPYLSITKDNKFNNKKSEFEFLKDEKNKKKRFGILIVLSIWSILFVAFGGFIRIN